MICDYSGPRSSSHLQEDNPAPRSVNQSHCALFDHPNVIPNCKMFSGNALGRQFEDLSPFFKKMDSKEKECQKRDIARAKHMLDFNENDNKRVNQDSAKTSFWGAAVGAHAGLGTGTYLNLIFLGSTSVSVTTGLTVAGLVLASGIGIGAFAAAGLTYAVASGINTKKIEHIKTENAASECTATRISRLRVKILAIEDEIDKIETLTSESIKESAPQTMRDLQIVKSSFEETISIYQKRV